jgi:hypothetical protein
VKEKAIYLESDEKRPEIMFLWSWVSHLNDEKGKFLHLICVLTARLARRSTHISMKIIYVEDNRVLLGVFKHQHLFSCKRDLRTPARVAL